MSITSFQFFALFAVSIGIYYAVPKKFQWCTLLVFSIYFFSSSSVWITGAYVLANVLVTFWVSLKIASLKAVNMQKTAGRYLFLGLSADIGLLAVLKYSNFLIYNCNIILNMLGDDRYIKPFDFAAPIGISYYTLISAGYMIDVYWGVVEPEKNLFRTALFIGYFPQLTSGPVSRFAEVKDQLYCGHKFSYERITSGLQRMLWGLFKKLVISTRAAIVVDAVYADASAYTGMYVWTAAALFLLQLYTDFSGCMDIVLGVSECYGIRLPENFRTPFFSTSVQEFWQRWHITLGAWFKDYVLYPVLRLDVWRRKKGRHKSRFWKKLSRQLPSYAGMLCVWVLLGFWHGGAWKFILGTGVWYWICIVSAQILEPVFKKVRQACHISTDNFGYHLFQSMRVFVLIAVGNMFFRLKGFGEAVSYIKSGFSQFNPWIFFDGSFEKMGLTNSDQHILLFGVFALSAVAVLQEKYKDARTWMREQFLPFRWCVWIAFVLVILIYGTYGPGYSAAEFIYRGF